MKFRYLLPLLFFFVTAMAYAEKPCASLIRLKLPNTTLTTADVVAAGQFAPRESDEPSSTYAALPSFCRVAATLKPSSDSDIKIEVWLPVSGWNKKLQAVGNGGWAGSISYSAMADALSHGYAASSTDTGHGGDSGSFVLGHPEKFIDFAYRSEHEMTVAAKAIIREFYGEDAKHCYWNGCSGGGRQGLLEAHHYPADFDGIIAGDPATFRRNAWALWLAQETYKDPARHIPPSKYPMIHKAVLDACDERDGLKDGLIDSPDKCIFDPKVLQCREKDETSCLTAPQVKAAQAMMSPAMTHDGRQIFPRLEPGTELRWARLAGGPVPDHLFLDLFKYVVYKNPDWDWTTFDLEKDSALADKADEGIIDLDADLTQFAAHGGKLLIYHGWADQQVAPGASIQFYLDAVKKSGAAQSTNWLRLFMAPGMAHCSGGEGPNTFDEVNVMEHWVEKGIAPDQIIALHSTNGKVDRTRPLCPYPQVARYKGEGSIDEAENFVCANPAQSAASLLVSPLQNGLPPKE